MTHLRTDSNHCYAFDAFVLDTTRCLLWHNGLLTAVPRKTLSLLCLLVTRHGEVIDRDEIYRVLWNDTHVGENTIARHIATLRKVLGEAPETHHFIVTITGRGYRFVAEVKPVAEAPDRQTSNMPGPVVAASDDTRADGAIVPRIPPRMYSWRPALSATGLAALAVVSYLTTSPLQPIVAREATSVVPLTTERGLQEAPTWSPDGKAVALTSDRDGSRDIWVQSIDGGLARRLTTSPEPESQPAWSPDGRKIAFRSEQDGGGIYIVPADGGTPERLSHGYAPQWAPDGSAVLVSSTDSPRMSGLTQPPFSIVPIQGAPIAVPAGRLSTFVSAYVNWMPTERRLSVSGLDTDGRWRFATLDPFALDASLDYWDIAPTVSAAVLAARLTLARFVWTADGAAVYFEETGRAISGVWRVEVDTRSKRLTHGPKQVVLGSNLHDGVALSRDGRMAVAVRDAQTRIWSFPLDEGSGRLSGIGAPVTVGGADERDPVVSADGSKLVYRTDHGTRQDVWLRSLKDGAEHRLLSDGEWRRSNPHWSHDGTRLVYMRTRAGSSGVSPAEVVVMATDSDREVILKPSVTFGPTGWTPDDSMILGNCRNGRGRRYLCTMPVAGVANGQRQVSVLAAHDAFDLYVARVSPDTRWVSFNSVDPEHPAVSTLFTSPASGAGPWVRISGEEPVWDHKSRWAPDGRTLYWISTKAGLSNVWGRKFNRTTGQPDGSPFQVTHFTTTRQAPAREGMELVITRDRLMLPVTEARSNIYLLDSEAQ